MNQQFTVGCRIPVGVRGSEHPIKAMAKVADRYHPGWFGIDPFGFICGNCGCTWGDTTDSFGIDLKKVSCSNCYSDNVMLTAIRVEMATFMEKPEQDQAQRPDGRGASNT